MLYREIIAVCSQIHTKHINALCGAEGGISECFLLPYINVSFLLSQFRPPTMCLLIFIILFHLLTSLAQRELRVILQVKVAFCPQQHIAAFCKLSHKADIIYLPGIYWLVLCKGSPEYLKVM